MKRMTGIRRGLAVEALRCLEKLSRLLSFVLPGLLFLGGGCAIERARRPLISRIWPVVP